MKTYKFDIGNSTEGKIGAVIYIKSETAEGALGKLRNYIGYDAFTWFEDEDDIDIRVYFNPGAISASDIDEVEDDGGGIEYGAVYEYVCGGHGVYPVRTSAPSTAPLCVYIPEYAHRKVGGMIAEMLQGMEF